MLRSYVGAQCLSLGPIYWFWALFRASLCTLPPVLWTKRLSVSCATRDSQRSQRSAHCTLLIPCSGVMVGHV